MIKMPMTTTTSTTTMSSVEWILFTASAVGISLWHYCHSNSTTAAAAAAAVDHDDHDDHDTHSWNGKSSSSSSSSSRWFEKEIKASKTPICMVNESNQVIPNKEEDDDKDTRSSWYRVSYVLIRQNSSSSPNHQLLRGIVHVNETYQQTALRILQDHTSTTKMKDSHINHLQQLFTFPYHPLQMWGSLFEYNNDDDGNSDYNDDDDDDEMTENDNNNNNNNNNNRTRTRTTTRMQRQQDQDDDDDAYVMELFHQHQQDRLVQRKFLKEYSSGDLDNYQKRPKIKAIFFDCDDTLYFDHWKVANQLTKQIEHVCTQQFHLPPGKAYELYKQYGTALRGLLEEGYLSNDLKSIEQYLIDTHDIQVQERLKPDPKLRKMLLAIDPSIPKFIFTASVSHHARNCLQALGIDDIFSSSSSSQNQIIDVMACQLETKHSIRAFELAMQCANIPLDEQESCLFLDDSLQNIATARLMKWQTVLVGQIGRDSGRRQSSEHAELEIANIHQLPHVLPELFSKEYIS